MDAAMGVIGGTVHPEVPPICPVEFVPLLQRCFSFDVQQRPSTKEILSYFPPDIPE
jgi:hypothetical protein